MTETKLYFASDYQEGAHPDIIRRLAETNLEHTPGYGTDHYTRAAKDKIRAAIQCPEAEIEFLIGGTQTNATVIDAFLRSCDGVISADTGHVNVHEAGAIEFCRHKVLALKSDLGKLTAEGIERYLHDFYQDDNCDHMVQPGMVYLSQPTEYGTLYSLEELTAISEVCRSYRIPLYVDGARLAYALTSKVNNVTLPDLARLCDVFYIGGTKCGALFGEAVVIPDAKRIPGFFTMIKQHGALLAKGRILGIQFDTLFTEDLYSQLGKTANTYADRIKAALLDQGVRLFFDSPTNQLFFIVPNDKLEALGERVVYNFGEKYDDTHSVIRFCTSWATTEEETQELIQVIREVL